jgi:hypothetical protein
MPSIAQAGARRTMMVAPGVAAFWRANTTAPNGGSYSGPYPSAIPGLTGWWDAGTYAGLVDANHNPLPGWNNGAVGIADKSGAGTTLAAYHYAGSGTAPQATPRLNGTLGGVGLNTIAPPNLPPSGSGWLLPFLDVDTGYSLVSASMGSGASWSVYFVWSRPNYMQGGSVLPSQIALLTLGTTVVLAADSTAGANSRLILFPGAMQTIITGALERRHTHSIIISNSPGAGVAVWLDAVQVTSSAPNPLASTVTAPLLFLHSGVAYGAAQCWFHEAAIWGRALSGNDITTLLSCATRWVRGVRKGIQLLVMGQSNAGYSLGDGAWHLLAQGIAWHLGALAYNVIGNWSSSGSATCVSGHGISNMPFSASDATAAATFGDYPGSFLEDPGDGSDPAGWTLGRDGTGVQAVLSSTPADDLSDIALIVWPWTETDSIRAYGDKTYYEHAQINLLAKVRAMVARSASSLPLMLWNAIPFGSGTAGGMQMVREAAAGLAGAPNGNAFVGLPQTSDSNPRGGTWNATNGVFTQGTGDYLHRDATDNIRFGRLAAPVATRAVLTATGGDTETSIPASLPVIGGPYVSHVYQQTAHSTTILLTITHDAGDDLIVANQAVTGVGFCIMDGGSVMSPGPIIAATACTRVDATHLQITLATAPENTQADLLFFYSYGPNNIFRGDAVYDNYSAMSLPSGWNIANDLGSAWALNYPLAATATPIAVSAAP